MIFVVSLHLASLGGNRLPSDSSSLHSPAPFDGSLLGRARWSPAVGTLVLLIGLNLLNYIDRYILPGEVSLIQRELHSTDAQMGALTTALFLTYMIAAPLTGWLGDHFKRKPLIMGGAVLWSLATLALGETSSLISPQRNLFAPPSSWYRRKTNRLFQ